MAKNRGGSHLAASSSPSKGRIPSKRTNTKAVSSPRRRDVETKEDDSEYIEYEYEENRYKKAAFQMKNRKQSGKKTPVLGGVLLVLATLIFFGGVFGLGTVMIITHGPSEYAKTLFVRTFNDTATLKKIPYLFMSEEEVREIVEPTQEEIAVRSPYSMEKEAIVTEVTIAEVDPEETDVIELVDITGTSWHGKMLVVHDPSLVKLATPIDGNERWYGTFRTVYEYIDDYNAIGGITAGGFDLYTMIPSAVVINDGKLLYFDSRLEELSFLFVGLTYDNRLVLEGMTINQAMESDLKSAISWTPVLVKDGVRATGLGGGYSARCAIGQRADGTILLVTIEGRMVSSLGASLDELAEFMEKQGCINAVNLDSGRSAVMYYQGEQQTKVAIGSGIQDYDRPLPNAFIVMPPEGYEDD